MKLLSSLIDLLQDKAIYTLTELADHLSISIEELGNILQYSSTCGIPIKHIVGQGYCLSTDLELLSLKQIQQNLSVSALNNFKHIEIYSVIDSTHSHLIDQVSLGKAMSGQICIAEYQTLGRGRHTRKWLANFATNIMLSVSWSFSIKKEKLAGLSLLVALALVQALAEYGIKEEIIIKWPNDIWFGKRKLAGILIDLLHQEVNGNVAVISIGLNANHAEFNAVDIDQPWINLQDIVGKPVLRNRLVAILLHVLQEKLKHFEQQGFRAFLKEWQRYDALYEKPIRLITPQSEISGVGQGINERGELKVKTDKDEVRYFSYGEVSVRIDS